MSYAPFREDTQVYKGTTFGFSFTIDEDGSPLDLTTLDKVEAKLFSSSNDVFAFDNDSEGSLTISGTDDNIVSGVASASTMDIAKRVYYLELRFHFANGNDDVYAVIDVKIIDAESDESQGAHDWVLDIDNDSETVTGQATSNLAEAIQAKVDAEAAAQSVERKYHDTVSDIQSFSSDANPNTNVIVLLNKNGSEFAVYEIDRNDTSTAGNGDTVIVDADGGRWKQKDYNIPAIIVLDKQKGIIVGDESDSPRISSDRDVATESLTVQPTGGDKPGSVEIFPSGAGNRSHFIATNTNDFDNFGAVELEVRSDGFAWLNAFTKGDGGNGKPTKFKFTGFTEGIRVTNGNGGFAIGTDSDPSDTQTQLLVDGINNSKNAIRVLHRAANDGDDLDVLRYAAQTGNLAWTIRALNVDSNTNTADFSIRTRGNSFSEKFIIKNDTGYAGFGQTDPDSQIHNSGGYTQEPLSSDPADPDPGNSVQWVSDGTESGEAGDVMIKINVGGTVKTTTLVDFSAI